MENIKKDRCFVIATGPSINNQDLTLLKDEIVIGMSSFFQHKDFKIINPKYYFITRIVQHFRYFTQLEMKNLLQDMDDKLSDETILFMDKVDKSFINKNSLFQKKEIVWLNYTSWDFNDINKISVNKFLDFCFVSEGALQIALYLKFKKIYLLGFDHDWFNGPIKYFDTEKVRKHFKRKEKELINDFFFDSEYLMDEFSKTFAKYKALYKLKKNIFNLNYNSETYVDVFPKIKYEDLLLEKYTEKELIINSKKVFKEIPSYIKYRMPPININKNLEFSAFYSRCYNKILELSKQNSKYILYGDGTFGKTIFSILKDKIVEIIDKETKLINFEFDYVIISVLGREKDIIKYLKRTFNIKENKIITFI